MIDTSTCRHDPNLNNVCTLCGIRDMTNLKSMTSPLNTIQEIVSHDLHYPWRVLVVCTLLNQTHGRGVRPMIEEFFRRVPDPQTMIVTTSESLDDLLRPLGFRNRRFVTLWRISEAYLDNVPYADMFGVGQYALDSLAIFVDGRTDVRPTDTWLRPYLAWREGGGAPVEWDRAGHDEWRASTKGRS